VKILVINSGSSSIKYRLFDAETQQPLAAGIAERIGESAGRVRHQRLIGRAAGGEYIEEGVLPSHSEALLKIVTLLQDAEWGAIEGVHEVGAVGHRVVHGGERFREPTIIDDEVCESIRSLSILAPLHNPANLSGIEVAIELFPGARQVAIFDTAFHQTMPPEAFRYAIPGSYYTEHGIRAYGFHGTSHLYVSEEAARYLGRTPEETNLITAHLGNGCSITAVRGGRSVDTSMGFSPLAGLIMGSRSGDIDPAVPFYMGTKLGMSFVDIDSLLNKESGLLGIAGSNDLRDLEARIAAGDEVARLAVEMYGYRIRKYLGAYLAALGRADAIVFTAGVGENSALVRETACRELQHLGIVLDLDRNRAGAQGPITEIQSDDSRIKLLIIRTDEELEIARQVSALLRVADGHTTSSGQ